LKTFKIGQIYKVKRKHKTYIIGEREDIKDFYDPEIEISLSSFYIIKDLFYSRQRITHVQVSEIHTGYSEIIEIDRLYGDFDEVKILRKIKIIKLMNENFHTSN